MVEHLVVASEFGMLRFCFKEVVGVRFGSFSSDRHLIIAWKSSFLCHPIANGVSTEEGISPAGVLMATLYGRITAENVERMHCLPPVQ